MQHLEELLSAGYEITFTSPLKDVYEAVLSGPDGDAMRGTGDSAAEALWDVSPFHAPRAPYPAVPLEETAAALAESAGKLHLTAAAISALWEEAQSRAVSALMPRVEAVEKRVDALETGPIDGDRVVLKADPGPVCAQCGAQASPYPDPYEDGVVRWRHRKVIGESVAAFLDAEHGAEPAEVPAPAA